MWVAYFFSLSHHAPNGPSVQLGVLYASKKPTGFGAVSPNHKYSVADTA